MTRLTRRTAVNAGKVALVALILWLLYAPSVVAAVVTVVVVAFVLLAAGVVYFDDRDEEQARVVARVPQLARRRPAPRHAADSTGVGR